ncbi:MAG: SPFH/Band 7/PHB domain protein, partial [Thermoplasmata archaeon]|nr:SPFH/Band 7/PHB domain protein [Thermoplasmata archaeon]
MADPTSLAILLVVLFAILVVLVVKMAHTVRPYEQGVLTILGSYRRLLNPGLHFVTPLGRVQRVDLRTRIETLPAFAAPLPDGTRVSVGARVEVRIVDGRKSVFQVADLNEALRALLKDSLLRALAATPPTASGPDGWRIAESA